MALNFTVSYTDGATPTLRDLIETLNPKGQLMMRKHVAGKLEDLMRTHIVRAAKDRHKTATRLGANPTNYLVRRADTVESQVNGTGPNGFINLRVYGNIFARVDGPVEVKPRNKKALALPAIAEAYGKRPSEIGGLRLVIFIDKKKAALAKVTGDGGKGPIFLRSPVLGPPRPGTDRWRRWKRGFGPEKPTPKAEIWFWLSKGVTLPQDRGLLPEGGDITATTEAAAVEWLQERIEKATSGPGFAPPGSQGGLRGLT